LGALFNEVSAHHRTRRFFKTVGDCMADPGGTRTCDVTGSQMKVRDTIVLPCGHCCTSKLYKGKVKQDGRCPVANCDQQDVTEKDVLVVAKSISDKKNAHTMEGTGPYGSKFAAIVQSLKEVLHANSTNRVLVFCQLAPLMAKLEASLEAAKINFNTLDGTPDHMHATMKTFKQAEGNEARVLLLRLDEKCAGANLTAANHVFFVHPVLQDGSRRPVDIETQAIGRARRYGQNRCVNVTRFVSQLTIEEETEQTNMLERCL